METGAGKESRTPDLNLGKVALYQLSYSRDGQSIIIASTEFVSNRHGSRAYHRDALLFDDRRDRAGDVIGVAAVERRDANAPGVDRVHAELAA